LESAYNGNTTLSSEETPVSSSPRSTAGSRV